MSYYGNRNYHSSTGNTSNEGPPSESIADHVAQSNPHPQYPLESELADVAFSGDYNDLINLPAGDAIQRIAGETISALKVVYELDSEIFLLSPSDAPHIFLLLGITLTGGDVTDELVVQRYGTVTDLSWSWSIGRVYLAASGGLTQVPPSTGYRVLIGSAVSSTSLLLNLQDPIFLG